MLYLIILAAWETLLLLILNYLSLQALKSVNKWCGWATNLICLKGIDRI